MSAAHGQKRKKDHRNCEMLQGADTSFLYFFCPIVMIGLFPGAEATPFGLFAVLSILYYLCFSSAFFRKSASISSGVVFARIELNWLR